MRRIFWAIIIGGLLLFSCTGRKAETEEGIPVDSLAESQADSSLVSAADSLSLLITETPMPRAADAMFDDFIFNFVANKRLQKERIVFPLHISEEGKSSVLEQSQWKMESFFMRQGYYTLIFDDDEQMSHMKDTAVSEAVVEKIMLKKNKVRSYYFKRINGAWMLLEVRTLPLESNPNASFLSFYKKFVTDSLFQVESIHSTVEFVGPDPDNEYTMMEGVITPDTWGAFAPQLPWKVLYNIVYGKSEKKENQKIFLLRGVSNGLELELRFKFNGSRWQLMKMTT